MGQNKHMLQFNTNYMVDIIKMRYLTEPRYRKYVKGFDFLPFSRKLGDKYGKKLMDSAIKKEIMQKLLLKEQFKKLQKLQEI